MRASPTERLGSSAAAASPPRPAGSGDLAALLELEISCFDEDRRDTPEEVRGSLADPRREVWVLDGPGGRIDGALFLRMARRWLSIESLATRPEMRGQGLGRRLLEWAEHRARLRPGRRVILEADASDPELLGWYERHGYRRTSLVVSFYSPGLDAWRMCRQTEVEKGN